MTRVVEIPIAVQEPSLRLQPRNERYRPQTLSPEKVTGLYKALYRFERVEE